MRKVEEKKRWSEEGKNRVQQENVAGGGENVEEREKEKDALLPVPDWLFLPFLTLSYPSSLLLLLIEIFFTNDVTLRTSF